MNKRDAESPLAELFGTKAKALAVVIGANCRRIRRTAVPVVTQDTLAKHARNVGLRWTASKVGQFERGEYNPTLTTVLAASIALSDATESDVDLTDLVASKTARSPGSSAFGSTGRQG